MLLVLLASALPPAAAQDVAPPAVYDPLRAPAPAVGQQVRVTWKERRSQINRSQHEGEPEPEVLEQRREVDVELVRAVTSVEGERATGYELRFARYRLAFDGEEDHSLEGRTVRLARDDDGALRVEPDPAAPPLPASASRFLASLTEELERPTLQRWLPARLVRPGEPWELEPETAAAVLVPEAKLGLCSPSQGELSEVERKITARFTIELLLVTLPSMGVRLSAGPPLRATRTYRWRRDAPLEDASWQGTTRFKGKATMRLPDGRANLLEVEFEETQSVTVEPLGE